MVLFGTPNLLCPVAVKGSFGNVEQVFSQLNIVWDAAQTVQSPSEHRNEAG
jgi:hypothetical protein